MKKTLFFCLCAYLFHQNIHGMEINEKGKNLRELQSKLFRKQKELRCSELDMKEERKKIKSKIKSIKEKIDSLHDNIVKGSLCYFSEDEEENLSNPRDFFQKEKITGANHGIFVVESTCGFFSEFSILCSNINFDSKEKGVHFMEAVNKITGIEDKIKKAVQEIHEIKNMKKEDLNSDETDDEDSEDENRIKTLKNRIKKLIKSYEKHKNLFNESVEHLNHVSGIIGSKKHGVAPDITVHLIEPLKKKESKALDLKKFMKSFLEKNKYHSRVISCSETIFLQGKDVNVFCDFLEKNDLVFLHAAGNDGKALKKRKNTKADALVNIDYIKTNRLIHIGNFDMYKNKIAQCSNLPGEQRYFLYAPGTKIKSEVLDFDSVDLTPKRLSGTSMAAPGAAGIFALLDQRFPEVKMSDIISVVLESGYLFLKHRDPSVEGYGLINGVKSFQTLKARFSKEQPKIHPILHEYFFQGSQEEVTLLNEYVLMLDKMNFPRCASIIYNNQKETFVSLLTKKEFDYDVFMKAQSFREKYENFYYTF